MHRLAAIAAVLAAAAATTATATAAAAADHGSLRGAAAGRHLAPAATPAPQRWSKSFSNADGGALGTGPIRSGAYDANCDYVHLYQYMHVFREERPSERSDIELAFLWHEWAEHRLPDQSCPPHTASKAGTPCCVGGLWTTITAYDELTAAEVDVAKATAAGTVDVTMAGVGVDPLGVAVPVRARMQFATSCTAATSEKRKERYRHNIACHERDSDRPHAEDCFIYTDHAVGWYCHNYDAPVSGAGITIVNAADGSPALPESIAQRLPAEASGYLSAYTFTQMDGSMSGWLPQPPPLDV